MDQMAKLVLPFSGKYTFAFLQTALHLSIFPLVGTNPENDNYSSTVSEASTGLNSWKMLINPFLPLATGDEST